MDDASDYDDGAKNAVVVEYVEIMALLGAERDLFAALLRKMAVAAYAVRRGVNAGTRVAGGV